MNIAICDDEHVLHKLLREAIGSYGCDRNIEIYTTCFTNGRDLINSAEIFDVIFMDYQMADLNGIETSEILRKNNNDTTIIFLSSYSDVVFDTFSVNTFRFLTKPLNKEKLYKALDDYRASVSKDNVFIIKTLERTWNIRHSDIVYAEAHGKHTIVRTVRNMLEVSRCLGEIEQMLPKEKFFRVHKSFIVNFSHISNYDKTGIFLDNKEKAALGNKYYNSFKTAFLDYIKRNNTGTKSNEHN